MRKVFLTALSIIFLVLFAAVTSADETDKKLQNSVVPTAPTPSNNGA